MATSNFHRRQDVSESPVEGKVQEDKANAYDKTGGEELSTKNKQSGDKMLCYPKISLRGFLLLVSFQVFWFLELAVGTVYFRALCYK